MSGGRRRIFPAPQDHVFAASGDERDPADPKPTEHEWRTMLKGTHFTTRRGTFRVGDRYVGPHTHGLSCVLNVCSATVHSAHPGNTWIVRIACIGCRPGKIEPWVLVQWYYSHEDLKVEFEGAFNGSVVINISPSTKWPAEVVLCTPIIRDASRLSKHERVWSNRQDLLSYRVFDSAKST